MPGLSVNAVSFSLNSQGRKLKISMQIDLHGYHPAEIVWNGLLAKIVQQVWEMGERELILIHGHGRNRGVTPGFVNTNTGFFGLQIRSALRHDKALRRWIYHTTLNRSHPGLTAVTMKPNRSPVRDCIDPDLLPKQRPFGRAVLI